MPVTSRKNKILNRVVAAYLAQDKASAPASTTVGANAAAGASTFTVASATGLAIGKVIRVGAGEYAELVQISNLVTTTVTPARPLRRAHDAGEPVVEQTLYDMGDVSGGASLGINGEVTEVQVENKRLLHALLNGFIDFEMSNGLTGVTPYTFAIGLGIPIANVKGTGVASDPKVIQSDGSEIGTAVNQCVVLLGVTNDGTPVLMELWGAETDYTGFQVTFARGVAFVVPAKWLGAFAFVEDNASVYVGDTTIKPSKSDLFDAIDEIEAWEDATASTLVTTSTAIAAAAQKNITLASTTNLNAGDWLKIGSGSTVEYHEVQTVASPVVLKTPLYRAQASGVAVVKQKLTSIGGILKGSAQFKVGGSVEKIQIEQSRATLGLKAGDAAPEFSFSIVDVTPSTIARVAGIAQSAVVSGRLDLSGTQVGTAAIDGLLLRGKNQAQRTVKLGLWGNSQGIQNILINLQKAGVNGLPVSLRPGSAFTLMVHD